MIPVSAFTSNKNYFTWNHTGKELCGLSLWLVIIYLFLFLPFMESIFARGGTFDSSDFSAESPRLLKRTSFLRDWYMVSSEIDIWKLPSQTWQRTIRKCIRRQSFSVTEIDEMWWLTNLNLRDYFFQLWILLVTVQ